MKQLFTLTILLVVLQSRSQSYYKGALITDVGGGLEIYNTKVQIHDKNTGKDTTQTDKAGNLHYTLGAEYALHKTYGVGLRFKGNNFFVDKDTVNNTQPTLKSNDIVAFINYHPYVTKALDVAVGADFGYSMMKWDMKDKEDNRIRANGTYFSFYLQPRVYIGPFGFYAKYAAQYFSYPKLKSNNENFNKNADYKLTGSPGFNFELGMQFRFIRNQEAKAN